GAFQGTRHADGEADRDPGRERKREADQHPPQARERMQRQLVAGEELVEGREGFARAEECRDRHALLEEVSAERPKEHERAKAQQPDRQRAVRHAAITSLRSKLSGRPNAFMPPMPAIAFFTKRSSTRSRAANAGSSVCRNSLRPETSVCFSMPTSDSV